ncbi:MAG TPA: multidrug efflux SMR transporter, partial [Gemmataceae bacterium]|nr:multidrug efflux SMR transporter [Gemmataceae bacterium]
MPLHWVYLLLAGCFECAFTTCLKLSDGLTKIGWSIAFVLLSIVSFGLLTLATAGDRISMGTAYAVWTGIGAFGTAAIGIIWFKDPA